MHEPDVPHVGVAAAAELQTTGLHDVEVELRGLVEPSLGVRLEPGREAEDLHTPPAGVGRRQGGGVQTGEHMGTPAGEPLLASRHQVRVHPVGQFVLGLEEGGQIGVGDLVVLDHQSPEGRGGIGRPGEEPGNDGVGGGIGLGTQAVEEFVAPVGHAHVASTFRASSRIRLGPPSATFSMHACNSARTWAGAASRRAQSVRARSSSILAPCSLANRTAAS